MYKISNMRHLINISQRSFLIPQIDVLCKLSTKKQTENNVIISTASHWILTTRIKCHVREVQPRTFVCRGPNSGILEDNIFTTT